MRAFLRRLRTADYTRLVEVRIFREAIIHNLHEFQAKYGMGIAPVLKSNAYGHGLVEVARIVEKEKLPFLCVDSYFEALILRNEKIASPLLILGYTPIENILGSSLKNTTFAIMGVEQLKEIVSQLTSPQKFHLEIDTGMHRHGIMPSELPEVFGMLSQNKNIKIEGLFTHFADAETPGSSLTATQIGRWQEAVKLAGKALPDLKYFHGGGTTGGFYASEMEMNALRLGIGLYGVNVSQDKLDLHPALQMVSRVTSIRNLSSHERIGYNGIFETKTPMRIASIPVGYAEGIDRRLSNKGSVLIRGVPCPIVGRVSMNISSVDVSGVVEAAIGDEVVVISEDVESPNSLVAIAKQCDTIPYEIMVHIPAHLHRTVC
jgi:alanine racemase